MIRNYLLKWLDPAGHPHVTDVDAEELGEAMAHVQAHAEDGVAKFTSVRFKLTEGRVSHG